jgi:hypothetical protein
MLVTNVDEGITSCVLICRKCVRCLMDGLIVTG